MAKSKDIIAVPEDELLVLTGPPHKLIGSVMLHNPGSSNLVVRNAGVTTADGIFANRPLRHALPTFVLRPDQGRDVPLKIVLDVNTPPGEYQVELDVAGQSRPAVLHVLEEFSATIQPRSLVIANLPGQAQQKRLTVTNKGNVAFTVGDMGPIDLKDDMVWDRAVRAAVEPIADKSDDIEELVVAVLRVAREQAYREGGLTVKNLSGNARVMPGQTVAIDLELSLQEALPPNSRYRGVMPILTQDLAIIVVSSTDPVASEPPAAATQSTTKSRKRSK